MLLISWSNQGAGRLHNQFYDANGSSIAGHATLKLLLRVTLSHIIMDVCIEMCPNINRKQKAYWKSNDSICRNKINVVTLLYHSGKRKKLEKKKNHMHFNLQLSIHMHTKSTFIVGLNFNFDFQVNIIFSPSNLLRIKQSGASWNILFVSVYVGCYHVLLAINSMCSFYWPRSLFKIPFKCH